MSFDEIMIYIDDWSKAFGTVIDKLGYSLADLFGGYDVIIPDEYKNITILGIMFGVGFTVFFLVTMWKWFKEIIF